MNQAIQVLDGCTYIEAKHALKVDVMFEGQMLICYINGADKQSLITLYNSKQFELEEIIERELEQDNANLNGEICLTAEQVYAY